MDLRYNTTEREARANRTRAALRTAKAAGRVAALEDARARVASGEAKLLSKLERQRLGAARARKGRLWSR